MPDSVRITSTVDRVSVPYTVVRHQYSCQQLRRKSLTVDFLLGSPQPCHVYCPVLHLAARAETRMWKEGRVSQLGKAHGMHPTGKITHVQ